MRLIFNIVSIHKHIFPSWMSMQITIKYKLSFFWKLSNQFFYSKIYWMYDSIRSFPPSIQILTT
jgi:hypothetical protein